MACRSGFGNCVCYTGGDSWEFQVKWRVTGDSCELFDLINAEAYPSADSTLDEFEGNFVWPASGFRLTRPITYPVYIERVEVTRDPRPALVQTGATEDDGKLAGPNPQIGPLGYHPNAPIPANQIGSPSLTVTLSFDSYQDVVAPFVPIEISQPITFGGVIVSYIKDDPIVGVIYGSAQNARAQLIPPGSILIAKGFVKTLPT